MQGHAPQCQNEDLSPFRRQVIPENRALLTELVHRETQANVPTRAVLGIQFSAISRALSNYQRHFVWGIENSVHWVLDVVFGDDYQRLRSDYGPRNMALVQRIALNLIRHRPSGRDSLTVKRKKAGWSIAYLIETIAAVPA